MVLDCSSNFDPQHMKNLIIFILILFALSGCKDWTDEIMECDLLNWDFQVEYKNNSGSSLSVFLMGNKRTFYESIEECNHDPLGDQFTLLPSDSRTRTYRGSNAGISYYPIPGGNNGPDFLVAIFRGDTISQSDHSTLKFKVTFNVDLSATVTHLNQ